MTLHESFKFESSIWNFKSKVWIILVWNIRQQDIDGKFLDTKRIELKFTDCRYKDKPIQALI